MHPKLLSYKAFAGLLALCLAVWGEVSGQLISTAPPVPAEVQILVQLEEVMDSWLVQEAAFPSGQEEQAPGFRVEREQMEGQLRALQGEMDFLEVPEVRKYILLFSEDKRSHTEAALGLLGVYGSDLDQALRQARMPRNLRYLPLALSACNVFASGPYHTAGIWRMPYHTALRYGLKVDGHRDERRDPIRSTRAALQCLRDYKIRYGNWNLAILAYVCGPAHLTRARQRAGGSAQLNALYEHLPTSGRDYLPAFVASVYIAQYHRSLGLRPLTINLTPWVRPVPVRRPLALQPVSKVLGVSTAELRQYNPWLCGEDICLPGYEAELVLPPDLANAFEARQEEIFAAQESAAPAPSEPEVVHRPEPKPTPKPEAPKGPPPGTKAHTYTIQTGDNLGKIARDHGVSVRDLQDWNQLQGTFIKAGEQLTLYLSGDKTAASAPPQKTTAPKESVRTTTYTVRQGDTFWSISQKYPGTSYQEIMEFNQMGEALQPGQVLRIPLKD